MHASVSSLILLLIINNSYGSSPFNIQTCLFNEIVTVLAVNDTNDFYFLNCTVEMGSRPPFIAIGQVDNARRCNMTFAVASGKVCDSFDPVDTFVTPPPRWSRSPSFSAQSDCSTGHCCLMIALHHTDKDGEECPNIGLHWSVTTSTRFQAEITPVGGAEIFGFAMLFVVALCACFFFLINKRKKKLSSIDF